LTRSALDNTPITFRCNPIGVGFRSLEVMRRPAAPGRVLSLAPAMGLLLGLALAVTGCGAGHSTSAPGTGSPAPATPTAGSGTGDGTLARRAPASTPSTRPFDLHAHSTTDPSSIWVVVNKKHPITPSDFVPDIAIVRGYQVARAAAPALTRMLDASDRAGMGFKIESAYRSYGYQVSVHGALVSSRGQAYADRLSARPGYSEHQTGLAVDLITPDDPACDFEACFAHTAGGRWIRANSWRFGFIVRYTPADEAVTGYSPEPWHLRYVGRALARHMHVTGVATLEQVFGIAGGGYPS
jgi:zinc D-Ala-D-Ala carboxypeptidase